MKRKFDYGVMEGSISYSAIGINHDEGLWIAPNIMFDYNSGDLRGERESLLIEDLLIKSYNIAHKVGFIKKKIDIKEFSSYSSIIADNFRNDYYKKADDVRVIGWEDGKRLI